MQSLLSDVPVSRRSIYGALICGAAAVAFLFGRWIGQQERDLTFLPFALLAGGILVFVVLRNPYIGIGVTIASLPVTEILPDIPFFSSAVVLIGGASLGSFLLQRLARRQTLFKSGLRPVHILAILFTGWLLISHPDAALFSSDRNWFFTFFQLCILLWLGGESFTTPKEHRVLMWLFIVSSVISAVFALQSGTIAPTLNESVRADGLAGSENSAARYFTASLILLFYLRTIVNQPLLKLAIYSSLGILITGLAFTVSRSGLILGVVAIILSLSTGALGTGRQRLASLVVIVLLISVVIPESYWQIAANSILPSVTFGTDTVGLRYGLWQAGLRMWWDAPLAGVGIGQFPLKLPNYGLNVLPLRALGLGPHSIYIGILAETGLVGLGLFGTLLLVCLRDLYLASKSTTSLELRPIARTWLLVLIIILIGGITKHDHYHKLLWLVMGMSVAVLPPTRQHISIEPTVPTRQ